MLPRAAQEFGGYLAVGEYEVLAGGDVDVVGLRVWIPQLVILEACHQLALILQYSDSTSVPWHPNFNVPQNILIYINEPEEAHACTLAPEWRVAQ